MESLIYFLLLAALAVVIMRFGCGAHVMGHGHEKHSGRQAGRPTENAGMRWSPPTSAVDPVCGMTVAPEKAKSSIHDGDVYYFCSADCREKFETSPAEFLKTTPDAARKKEHHHG